MRKQYIHLDDIPYTYVPETLGESFTMSDNLSHEELVINLEIDHINMTIANFVEHKQEMLNDLYAKLHLIDEWKNGLDNKNALSDCEWDNEMVLVDDKQKISFFKKICKSNDDFLDKLTFDEWNGETSCLSVYIDEFDEWDEKNYPTISITPEFILHSWVLQPYDDGYQREITLDIIQEVIVNKTKYTFIN